MTPSIPTLLADSKNLFDDLMGEADTIIEKYKKKKDMEIHIDIEVFKPKKTIIVDLAKLNISKSEWEAMSEFERIASVTEYVNEKIEQPEWVAINYTEQ